MQLRAQRSRALRAAAALVSVSVLAHAAPLQTGTASYQVLDNIEGSFFNMNAVPIRPMALSSAENRVYAVNTNGNTVAVYTSLSGQPSQVWATPWNPVSIALWNAPSGAERVLVVCRGSYVLAMLDGTTGEIVRLLALSPEPGDLIVDQATNRAFVSCAGQDVVQEIDLTGAMSVVRTFELPVKMPLHLCFDENKDVLVAPMLSGNNSVVHKVGGINAGLGGVLDLANPAIAQPGWTLPDRDLYRLVRSTGAVQPICKGLGTLLFTVGLQPGPDGDLWLLNTEANNKDKFKQSEAAIKGEVVSNRLSIVDRASLPSATSTDIVPPTLVVNLDGPDTDPVAPGNQFDTTRTVGQPIGLTITAEGFGLVCGLLTDNVTVLDPAGNWVTEWNLPDGSIPRAVLWSPVFGLIYVYCWGTNTIEVYSGAPVTHVKSLTLGYDPTPAAIKAGRKVFYDGSKSANNNQSCHSCHPNGGTDMVTWNLSKPDEDDKGPLVTQTLLGIDRLEPFHWRGEQQVGLLDFNPAFVALLGASAPLSTAPNGEFTKFEDFVLSLRNSANPFQNENRVLDNAIQPPMAPGAPTASATQGQLDFMASSAFADCQACHAFPTGSNNEIQADAGLDLNPRRQRFEVGHFFDLHRKEQDADRATPGIQTVTVKFQSPLVPDTSYPVVGSGVLHAGVADHLHQFVSAFAGTGPGNLITAQDAANITAAIHQWDQGVGPAIHRCYLLDAATVAAIGPKLSGFLKPQALARNCDIVVFGTVTFGGLPRFARWSYDRALDRFVPDDPALGNQRLVFFTEQAQQGLGRNVFFGSAVGTGELLGNDLDGDGLVNQAETLIHGTNPLLGDTDGDRDWDGHEVANGGNPTNPSIVSSDVTNPVVVNSRTQWFTTRNATLSFQTNEPTAVSVNYSTPLAQPLTAADPVFSKYHRVILGNLLASTAPNGPFHTYNGTVTFTDLGGRTTVLGALPNSPAFFDQFGPQPITTRPFQLSQLVPDLVVADLVWTTPPVHGSGTVQATAQIRAEFKTGAPGTVAAGAVPIFRVLKNGKLQTTVGGSVPSFDLFTPDDPLTPEDEEALFSYTSAPGALAGPFVIGAPTDAGGLSTVTFSLAGLATGDVVTLNVEILGQPGPLHTASHPELLRFSFGLWSMPDTKAGLRKIETTH